MLDVFSEPRTQAAQIARFVRAVMKLSATGAFSAMGLSLCFADPAEFISKNALPAPDRARLLVAVLIGACAPAMLALAAVSWKKATALAYVDRIASLLRPLLVLGFLPVLLVPNVWFTEPLPFLVALSCLGILLEGSVREALSVGSGSPRALTTLLARLPAQLRSSIPLATVVVAALAYTAFTFYYSLQQHYRLSTSAYDLGIYDNLMFNAMKGHPFRSPVLLGPSGGSYLQGHAEFAMLLFVPLYALYPSAVTLLGLQALLIGCAAIPLFLFVRQQLTAGAGVVLAICYLLFAPLHGASFYDFHWLPLAIFFHFWLYYAIATRKTWLLAASWAVLVLMREDVSVGLVFLGLFLVVTGIRPKLGLFFVLANSVTFILIKFVIMHSVGEFVFASMIYGDLVAPGEKGFGSVIKTLLINPMYVIKTLVVEDKLVLVLHLFAPLLFLPLRRPSLALLVAAGSIFTLLTTSYPPTVSIRFQYPTHWIPYLFAATTIMLGWLSRQRNGANRRRAALASIIFSVTVHSYCFGALLQHRTFIGGFFPVKYGLTAAEAQTYSDLRELVAQIPREASVAATERELPHLSNREWAYALRSHHGDADYILVRFPLSKGEKATVTSAINNNPYGLLDKRGSHLLLKRNHESADTEAALRRAGLQPPRKP